MPGRAFRRFRANRACQGEFGARPQVRVARTSRKRDAFLIPHAQPAAACRRDSRKVCPDSFVSRTSVNRDTIARNAELALCHPEVAAASEGSLTQAKAFSARLMGIVARMFIARDRRSIRTFWILRETSQPKKQ